jgi:hypothetical protein
MTSTSLSANPMPEYVILDIDAHAPMITWLCDEQGEDESLLYPALLECLKFENDEEFELAFFLNEYRETNPYSIQLLPVLDQVATAMRTQLKQLRLYERWYLDYCVDRILPGAVVLVRRDTI